MTAQREPLPLRAHVAVWVVVGCAYVLISVPHIWAALRSLPFRHIGPYHTTDSYMASLLDIDNGSERLIQAIASLPADRPLATVLREGDDEAVVLAYLVTYFGWPREVHNVAVNSANAAAKLRALESERPGGVFFCRIYPPPTPTSTIVIGRDLLLVPKLSPGQSTWE